MVKKCLTDLAANKGLVKKHGFTSPPQSVTGVKMLGYETRARVLEAGAKVLEQEIDAMRRDAARLRARATQKQQEKERRNIWKKVATYMDAGLSRDRAIGAVASTFAATTADPDAHVRYWCDWAEKNRTECSRWHRDREIMRLAALGYTNKEIACHPVVDQWNGGSLHEKSVSRIISRKIGRR